MSKKQHQEPAPSPAPLQNGTGVPRTDWRGVPTERREILFKLYDKRKLTAKHAAEVGMPLATLKRRLREWRQQRLIELDIDLSDTWMPDSPSRDWNDFPVIKGDNAIIISDIEIPDHDPVMLEAALTLGIAQNIKTLIIAGDYLATDHQALNEWAETWAEGNQINYEGAVGIALKILAKFLDWFDTIIVIEGNHDDRISRATKGEVWFGMLLREAQLLARDRNAEIIFTRYGYMYLETRRGFVCVMHQRNYSVNPVTIGKAIYHSENGPHYDPTDPNSRVDKCHMVTTHVHLEQSGVTEDGLREIWATGTMRDPRKTKYLNRGKNKYPNWNQGFLMVKNGFFYRMSRHNTDWSFWLNEYAAIAEIAD